MKITINKIYLEEGNGELLMNLGGDPDSELIMNWFCFQHLVHDFNDVVETQMAVL